MRKRGNSRWSVVVSLLITSSVTGLLIWSSAATVPEQYSSFFEAVIREADWRIASDFRPLLAEQSTGTIPEAPQATWQSGETGTGAHELLDELPLIVSPTDPSFVNTSWDNVFWEPVTTTPPPAPEILPAQSVEWESNTPSAWTPRDLPPLSPPTEFIASVPDAPLTGPPSSTDAASSTRIAAAPGEQSSPPPESTTPTSTAKDSPNKNRHIHEIRDWLWGVAYPVLGSGIYIGNELTLLSTERTGQTSVRFTDLQDGSIREASGQPGFGTGYRLTVGMRGDVVGFRARYWTFCEEHARLEHQAPQGDWPEFSVLSRLEMSAFDIELTQQHCLLGMQIETSFGGRHARYEAMDVVTGFGSLHKIMDVHGLAQSYGYLSGYGPTFSIGGRRALPWSWWGCAVGCAAPLGHAMPVLEEDGKFIEFCPSHCGWSWYWNLRGSVLWADTKSSSLTDAQVIVDGGAGQQGIARSRDNALLDRQGESGLLQGEFHLGLEYHRAIACLPASLVFRAGLEYQRWDMGRNQTESESFAQFSAGETGDLGARVDASAFTRNRHLDLFGLNFMVGINY
jgi:hypothetical protein